MKSVLAVFLLLFVGFTAYASDSISDFNEVMVPRLGSGDLMVPGGESFADLLDETYQIGEEWGKLPVTEEMLSQSPVYRRAAGATARVGGGTGFYLGRFNGTHVVATNNHVCPSNQRCRGTIRFPVLGKSVRSAGVLGTFPEIDLSLVAVEVSPEDEAVLAAVAANFAFSKPVRLGQKLITIGFGVANNSRREMVANFDSDCVVFSRDGEFRQMADPDDLNPGQYKVWSFANGCDVSHGDSGSAMVDRESGEVVGLIWTGKIPKNARVRNSRYLQDLLAQPNEETWQELSYAVPAAKIKEVLGTSVQGGTMEENTRRVIGAIIGQ